MTPTFAEEESVAEVDAEDTGCRCQQMLVSLSDEDLAFMDSPSFPSVETHSSKDTQDGRHRAGPRRNHKIEKVIAQLRTKRVHARSELIEFLTWLYLSAAYGSGTGPAPHRKFVAAMWSRCYGKGFKRAQGRGDGHQRVRPRKLFMAQTHSKSALETVRTKMLSALGLVLASQLKLPRPAW
eukprot:CAMPEP_0181469270 /NCGR_PEP_ID=MMETSP1110-20121109/37927_1 /TAXON_ID=174948 /ORGANISM="Symbiodinium sp., Strain CCMP421" /LENGTH=180 /DNA_ID=CAMNT_0023594161 /DNA_START=1 /DNA_END=543 /DNA_ORIENTATION=-